MKISVVGLWHLGMTYSIGLAQLGHEVIGIDPNEKAIQTLASGNLLVYEPKLKELLETKLKSNDLKFSLSYEHCADSKVIFLTFDTPIDNEDSSDIESAEMSKHALNAFLALSITFAGEISQICSSVGADAKEVELALKSDSRIGSSAYLSPGLGFSGGTLARDVNAIAKLQRALKREASILSEVMNSNKINNSWVEQSLREVLPLKSERIVFCGVSYVQGTNTLRRSISLDVMSSLSSDGYEVCFVEDETLESIVDFRFHDVSKSNEMQIDALVIMKNLKMFETNQEYITQIISQSTWIFDPFRLLEGKVARHLEMKHYLSIGMKI